ncbi:MAG: hypothetical protein AAF135_02440 [Bacteroidota bacterium]
MKEFSIDFIQELQARNEALFWSGVLMFLGAAVTGGLIFLTDQKVLGINAWIKPTKFFLSAGIFVWTLGWLLYELRSPIQVQWFSWAVIAIMFFELIYITWKAGLGDLSHFNTSSAFHANMFTLMGAAIMFMTAWTAYIGLLFFVKDLSHLPEAYVWGIRLGITLFVIFAMEGAVMGRQLAHTVGAPDGGEGLPVVNWSKQHGDLRIAHFFGMHALQILPLAGYYVIESKWGILLFSLAYLAFVSFTLWQALQGRPFLGL